MSGISCLMRSSLNGARNIHSAFDLWKIYQEFIHTNKGVRQSDCTWVIGNRQIATEVLNSILKAKNQLYGISVVFVNAGVGAVILPPNWTVE